MCWESRIKEWLRLGKTKEGILKRILSLRQIGIIIQSELLLVLQMLYEGKPGIIIESDLNQLVLDGKITEEEKQNIMSGIIIDGECLQ